MNHPETVAERAARIAAELRRHEQEEADRRPPPPPHWQQAAEERDEEPEPSRRFVLEMGDVVARGTACARLRRLLADGEWHSALELVDVGGLRYGGRLFELRRGADGEPALDVESEARPHRGRLVWFYRAARARPAP